MGSSLPRRGGHAAVLGWLVSQSTLTGVSCFDDGAAQGSCGGAEGHCAATSALATSASSQALRWRGFPYRVSNPAFARTVYGGDYIRAAFKDHGFEGPVEGDDWDVLWTHRPQEPLQVPPRPGGRLVNHCGYFGGAGDKCGLARHVARLRASNPAPAGHRYFRTYELRKPDQVAEWQRDVVGAPEKYWLLKPCLGGASKGIQILRGVEAIEVARREYGREAVVAQEYLEQPFLGFGGRKFHLRLYIVVTRWEPVGAYLYDNGLVFRSLHSYSSTPEGARDAFSSISSSVEALPLTKLWRHLDASAEVEEPTNGGGVLPASTVRSRIASMLRELLGSNLEESFGDPKAARSPGGIDCFDLFGADVILDQELRPLVMELNSGPNMWVSDHGEAHQDILAAVKTPLVQELVQWLASRIRRRQSSPGLDRVVDVSDVETATADEAEALVNFTRLL